MELASLLVAAIAMLAACAAAYFAWNGPSKEDVERVIAYTAETAEQMNSVKGHLSRVEDHLGIQNDRAELESTAKVIAIEASGEDWFGESIVLYLKLKDERFSIREVALLNREDFPSGTIACAQIGPALYNAIISGENFVNWQRSGMKTSGLTTAAMLRVHLTLGTSSLFRTLKVDIKMRYGTDNVDLPPHKLYATIFGAC